jgi:glycosyltransferase involved in cell wall biosynthesis
MSSWPKLDAVIPVLNGEATVEDAVQSVLEQRGVNTRAIVVDAGSTDRTADVVRSLMNERVVLVCSETPLLAGAARNRGLKHCRAPWLSFLDADDRWPPDRSRALLAAIHAPSLQMAVGNTMPFGEPQRSPSPAARQAPCSGNFLLARSTFERVGPFHPALPVGEVVEWIARARAAGIEEVHVPVVALQRRSHGHNTSRERREAYGASVLQIVAEHRRRREGGCTG